MRDAADNAGKHTTKKTPAAGGAGRQRPARTLFQLAVVVLLLIFLFLQYRLWIGDGSLAEISRIEKQRDTLKAANDKAMARNDAMQNEVDDLKRGDGAAEGRAREEMGMIKPDETFFLTVPDENSAHTAPDSP